jgi:hypothetical protein
MKTALIVIMAGFVATGARADLIISLANGGFNSVVSSGTLTVEPGMEYLVTATLTNVGSTTIVMNNSNGFASLDVNTAGDPMGTYFGTPDTTAFAPPDTLAPDAPVDVDYFNLTVSASAQVGAYDGWTYEVFDADGANIGSGLFNVIVQAAPPTVPEPGSFGLIGIALGFAAAYQRRRLRT